MLTRSMKEAHAAPQEPMVEQCVLLKDASQMKTKQGDPPRYPYEQLRI